MLQKEGLIPGIRPLRTILEEPRRFEFPRTQYELDLRHIQGFTLETIFDEDRIKPRREFRGGHIFTYSRTSLERIAEVVDRPRLSPSQLAFIEEHGYTHVLELIGLGRYKARRRHVWVPAIISEETTGWEGVWHD